MDRTRQQIVCVAIGTGKVHDFALFKGTPLALAPTVELLADTGYLGSHKIHRKSQIPHKSSQLKPLTPDQKQENKALASQRIVVEHSIRTLKRFRLLSSTYRNKRKRFGLRVNLIAAIVNLHR